MSTKLLAFTLAAGLLGTGALAQHEEHHAQASPQAEPQTPKSDASSGAMMSRMSQMKTMQDESAKLADELLKSFAAIEQEKDPAALKTKLAEHGKLLHELQEKLQSQSQMMDRMHQMMDGSKMGSQPKN